MLSFVQLDSLPYQCSSRYFENALHRLTLYVLTYTTCQMSKTFIGGVCHMSRVQIGGTGRRRNVRLCRMQLQTVQFSDGA